MKQLLASVVVEQQRELHSKYSTFAVELSNFPPRLSRPAPREYFRWQTILVINPRPIPEQGHRSLRAGNDRTRREIYNGR